VIHWKRLRRADQQVVCVEDAYLNEILLPGFLQAPLPASLYDELAARGLRPTWAEDTVTADVATPDEADLLGVPAGSAVLRQTRRALAGDAVVEVSRSCYRSDKYTLRVQLGSEA
jgi:GntR family transcriptional regulator